MRADLSQKNYFKCESAYTINYQKQNDSVIVIAVKIKLGFCYLNAKFSNYQKHLAVIRKAQFYLRTISGVVTKDPTDLEEFL